FSSIWISNVASPGLSYSLAQPYSRSLVLGIALAANVGGQVSPILSPQNLIGLEYLNPQPSWFVWFLISIPI
ncbi:hypothetical protein BY996DRAFT_4540595, partial [Phakopsora pachyrhizi]